MTNTPVTAEPDKVENIRQLLGRSYLPSDLHEAMATLFERIDSQSRELAALSSPPEERREMNMPALLTASFHQGEWCLMTTAGDVVELVEDNEYCGYAESKAMRDTLLQDLRRYSNAHKILLAERDEARGKVSNMDTTLGAYINRERNLIAAAERNKDLHCLAEAELREAQKRIERLEGALKWYADPGHWTALDDGSDQEQENLLTAGLDHGWLRAHNALAAADGQQPYIVQGFWSPCRKYIASVHISNGGLVAVQDDNGDVWEPTGPAQDMAKVTP